MNIPFYKPYITGDELTYIQQILTRGSDLAGDGVYTKKVHEWFEKRYGVPKVLLTTSGTTALELAVRLLNLSPGDEVIVPSFTFSSTVNAVLLQYGVKARFVDILPETFNIDPAKIRSAITPNTKAIIAVHYAGVACEMDAIMDIALNHNLKVIEDAAQAIESTYKGKYLGTIGDFGCMSFHGTKNITCGEGGAVFINTSNLKIIEQAEIIREKGTNRSKFLRGLVDKYTWVDLGGSYLPSDLLSAFLFAQLEHIDTILSLRRKMYDEYIRLLTPLAQKGYFSLPRITKDSTHNAHIMYIVLPDESTRNRVMDTMRAAGISAAFHYVPLHSSPQGVKIGNAPDSLPITTDMAGRILRLPLYSTITTEEINYVVDELSRHLNQKQI